MIAHAHETANFLAEYQELLGSTAHWAFELTVEAVTGTVGFVAGALWVRRHDAKHHGADR